MGDGNVTSLLHQWRSGDADAVDKLTPIVYRELRRIAAAHLRGERPNHTLQPTELVSEAFLRLVGGAGLPEWKDRVHFFACAARQMRNILVDHARRRSASKRGGEAAVPLADITPIVDARAPDLLALDEALEELARADSRKAQAVEFRYFGGLTNEEIAAALGVHTNTVVRDLRFAEAWLRTFLDTRV